MSDKELLKAMGFEHQQYTDYYQLLDGSKKIMTSHIITHPDIPGLFLNGETVKKAAAHIVSCIRILTLFNEGGKTADELREMGLLQNKMKDKQ